MGQSRNGGNRREGEIFTNTRYRFSAAFQRLMILLYTLHQKSTWAVPNSPRRPRWAGADSEAREPKSKRAEKIIFTPV